MNPEDVMTVAEIAAILKLNQQSVRNWIDQGALPAIRVGRRVRIRWGGVEAMMKPAGPATPGAGLSRPSADAQAFWEGEYKALAAL
jgi:excisionase family DNA binding protein